MPSLSFQSQFARPSVFFLSLLKLTPAQGGFRWVALPPQCLLSRCHCLEVRARFLRVLILRYGLMYRVALEDPKWPLQLSLPASPNTPSLFAHDLSLESSPNTLSWYKSYLAS